MIHLAFEASLLAGKKTGIGQYAYYLLLELKKCEDLQITLLHSSKKWCGPDLGLPTQSYYFVKESLGIYFRLNSMLNKIGADIFHAPGNTGLPSKVSIPSVVTIHDLFALLHTEKVGWKYRFSFRLLSRWVVNGASHIFCNSQQTFDEMDSYFAFPKEKMTVTHLGPCKQTEWQGGGDYFLCVGALEERKGQAFLTDAYLAALQEKRHLPKLVFVGPDRGDGEMVNEAIERSKGQIVWRDYVDDLELEKLYRNTRALLIPSQYEGFGLPLLEGLLSGVPVVCSDIPIFHEVGQSYVDYCTYGNLEEWKRVLSRTQVYQKRELNEI